MNCVAGLDEDWNLHWPAGPELNHFTHRIVNGNLARIPQTLHRKPIIETPAKEIRTWRKLSEGKWERPYTVTERQRQANRWWRRVYVTWETKSPQYANPNLARRLVGSLSGKWCVFTLATMALWGEKLKALNIAGAGTALDVNGWTETSEIHMYYPEYIDRIWGHPNG
jgi:hypothetical protein